MDILLINLTVNIFGHMGRHAISIHANYSNNKSVHFQSPFHSPTKRREAFRRIQKSPFPALAILANRKIA